ncbi:PspA-associated protein PspAB [Actinorugispora endophytica]|uniref:Uncharacterized protein n=1 Tax=Actinorugispora endophytica TaxID=1605990 RepID=A0A4R6V2X4_9ACTN|nr:hypothetical protein [Actinorugispora endophytica]TDQ52487.1 hypothetical protein EV190_106125 [Actinorugispora endophytica]
MGFLRALLGRSKPVEPDLDRLFGLPSAAVALESVAGFTPTGTGSVAFRAAEGQAFATLQREVTDLLGAGEGPEAEPVRDEYGYTWLVLRAAPETPGDVTGLVADLHAVNSTLEGAGFGPSLLCSLVAFADTAGRRVALVYLYKRGTFYPFAPRGANGRDSALELQIEAAISGELAMEKDRGRWFPVYGAPGLH